MWCVDSKGSRLDAEEKSALKPRSPLSVAPQADNSNNLLRRVNLTNGLVTTLAGGLGGTAYGFANGTGTAAAFHGPSGVAIDAAGSIAIVVRVNAWVVNSICAPVCEWECMSLYAAIDSGLILALGL